LKQSPAKAVAAMAARSDLPVACGGFIRGVLKVAFLPQ